MNTKVIAGIVAVVIIAGAAFLLMRNKGASDSQVASNSQPASSATEATAENTSLKNLIADHKNKTCTFSVDEQSVQSTGTVYVSNGKMRGDFNTTANNVARASHMIYDGTTANVWIDGQANGFKMKFDADEAINNSNNQSVDPNKNYQYSCKGWSGDNSKFELPANISFSEIPTLPTGAGASASGSSSMDVKAMRQAACSALKEPAKTQCLTAIK